jgi:hypothetical protein
MLDGQVALARLAAAEADAQASLPWSAVPVRASDELLVQVQLCSALLLRSWTGIWLQICFARQPRNEG